MTNLLPASHCAEDLGEKSKQVKPGGCSRTVGVLGEPPRSVRSPTLQPKRISQQEYKTQAKRPSGLGSTTSRSIFHLARSGPGQRSVSKRHFVDFICSPVASSQRRLYFKKVRDEFVSSLAKAVKCWTDLGSLVNASLPVPYFPYRNEPLELRAIR